eukprot:366506-Chlamydomonas_euryale.AAC.5
MNHWTRAESAGREGLPSGGGRDERWLPQSPRGSRQGRGKRSAMEEGGGWRRRRVSAAAGGKSLQGVVLSRAPSQRPPSPPRAPSPAHPIQALAALT